WLQTTGLCLCNTNGAMIYDSGGGDDDDDDDRITASTRLSLSLSLSRMPSVCMFTNDNKLRPINVLMELLGTVEEEEEQASSVSTDEGHSTEEGTVLDESEGLQNKDEDEDDALFNQLVEEIEKRMK